MAAAVVGMTRATGRPPNARLMAFAPRPAAMETITASGPSDGAYWAAASCHSCGLTQSSTVRAAARSAAGGLSRAPARSAASAASEGCGSTVISSAGAPPPGRGLRQARLLAGHQRHAVTEDHLAVFPELEVAEPDARVHLGDEVLGGGALGGGDGEVHREAELQAVALRPPGEPEFVVLPVAGQAEGEIAILGAVEGKVLGREHMLHDIERIGAKLDAVV